MNRKYSDYLTTPPRKPDSQGLYKAERITTSPRQAVLRNFEDMPETIMRSEKTGKVILYWTKI